MPASIIFHLLASFAYAILGVAIWRPILVLNRDNPAIANIDYKAYGSETTDISYKNGIPPLGQFCLIVALVLHGIGLAEAIIVPTGLHLGWALAFSAAIWLGMLVFWLENFFLKISGILLLLLPIACMACVLAAIFPYGYLIPHGQNDWLRIHLLISMMAYGLITVAALHAALMTLLDRYLHRPFTSTGQTSWVAYAISAMPPLLILEKLLFRLIWIGFFVLSLSVVSGILVSLLISNQLLPRDHKTVFTLLSWFTFGGLLLGRHLKGWRGRTALRWTLVGFAFLLLSYTGSRFVMEIILHRGTIG